MTQFSDLVHYDDLTKLRLDEVIALLTGNLPSRDLLGERERFILEIRDKGVVLRVGRTPGEVAPIPTLQVTEIRGMCAQPGKIVGRAKIVLTPAQCSKIKDGDILVTAMSTPDFLSGMMRAAAFVTDIGGITSHAAIVSREMKKPCIVGTKIATKVLHDGDLVEVDAEQGVVRMLERHT